MAVVTHDLMWLFNISILAFFSKPITDKICVDISTQILSVIGLLKKANIDILNSHIRSCVTTAILESEDQGEEKIEEIINIIDKYIK